MPSFHHEILVELFRENGKFAAGLLRACAGIATHIESGCGDHTAPGGLSSESMGDLSIRPRYDCAMSGACPDRRASVLLFAGLMTACGNLTNAERLADIAVMDGGATEDAMTSHPGDDAGPAPDGPISVDVVTANGTGCPGATATATGVSPDSFTVTFAPFQALVGGAAGRTDFRKNCNLNVLVHVPEGSSFAIVSGDYRGFASLARGAAANQRANYFFQGQSTSGLITHNLPPGPFLDDWQTTDTIDLASLVFSPCGAQRNLNINIELRVAAGSSDATTTSFVELTPPVSYGVVWKRCPSH